MDVLRSSKSFTAPLIARAIVDQIARFGICEQHDDITVVVAKKIA